MLPTILDTSLAVVLPLLTRTCTSLLSLAFSFAFRFTIVFSFLVHGHFPVCVHVCDRICLNVCRGAIVNSTPPSDFYCAIACCSSWLAPSVRVRAASPPLLGPVSMSSGTQWLSPPLMVLPFVLP